MPVYTGIPQQSLKNPPIYKYQGIISSRAFWISNEKKTIRYDYRQKNKIQNRYKRTYVRTTISMFDTWYLVLYIGMSKRSFGGSLKSTQGVSGDGGQRTFDNWYLWLIDISISRYVEALDTISNTFTSIVSRFLQQYCARLCCKPAFECLVYPRPSRVDLLFQCTKWNEYYRLVDHGSIQGESPASSQSIGK